MKSLPIDCSDSDIKSLVVEWSELLAHHRYSEALALLPHSDEEIVWTAGSLEEVIAGYGCFGPEDKELLALHGVPRFEVTSLFSRPDRDEIINTKITVDREHLYGLPPERYLGMVHYDDVPLSGFRSDLTARFHIMRVGSDRLTLEFLDLHVM